MALIVQKYGGTSVGSLERIQHVAKHIADTVAQGNKVVAVISAMGDQTDELLKMAHAISAHPPRREVDMLLTSGERIAMALVSIALNEIGQKAMSLTGSQSGIITDTVHGNARIDKILGYRILNGIESEHVVIVAGFQGVSAATKEITTLGRGGSDLSAVALASALNASSCQLYKDVDGVMSADPRIVKKPKLLSSLPWTVMTEMAWGGASVIHPRGAHLAAKYNLPIEIRSSFNLNRPGTLVKGLVMEQAAVQGVVHKNHLALIRGEISSSDQMALQKFRAWLWQRSETPQIQTQNDLGESFQFVWSIPQDLVSEATEFLKSQCTSKSNFKVVPCGVITIVGSGFWQNPEVLEKISRLVEKTLHMDVKNHAITFALEQGQVEGSVEKLHEALIAD